ncbi:MAG: DUF423 domain-containing protein [Bacteroidota bacterium]
MKVLSWTLIVAALLGLTGVILGAMGAHALESRLDADQLDAFETAVRFQMYHAFMLFLIGLVPDPKVTAWLQRAAWAILAGTLLFSGSIYLLVLTSLKIGIVTPIGGSILILGWAGLLLWAIGQRKN